MRLHHVALWCSNVDDAASFWERYFDAVVGDQYESRRQAGFFSRFAHIEAADLRIELMTKPGLSGSGECFGWAHIAISLGSQIAVDEAAKRFAADGRLVLGPRTTGDGYYEALVSGPDGLLVELVN